MAGRRRKKNPLLTRILIVSIAAHAVALPIAAHFGAFQKLERKFGTSTLVVINTPPIEVKKAAVKEKPKPAKPHAEPKRTDSRRTTATPHNDLAAPKLLVSSGPTADGGGPEAVSGTGKAGVLPKITGKTGTGTPTPDRPPETAPPPPSNKTVAPPPPPPSVTPPPPPPPAAVKKFVQVETSYAPEPVIPDDLRALPLDATAVIEADVDKNGQPENIRVAQSSGTRELDDLSLDTARKYRFKPAKLGDDPVEGHVRFRIVFKVE